MSNINKEKIIKLLESSLESDILLGIELAYNLPFDEFESILIDRELKISFVTARYFEREENSWAFYKYIHKSKLKICAENWIDITPENFKT